MGEQTRNVPRPVGHYYSISPWKLDGRYDKIVTQCHAQGITKVSLLTSLTGKLVWPLDQLQTYKKKFEEDGLQVAAMNFAIGHPNDHALAGQEENASPADFPYFDGDPAVPLGNYDLRLIRGFRYAINEFGRPVFFCACPNPAWTERNECIIRQLASVFDLIWYDDDFRVDGDLFAGTPFSAAGCYCDDCLTAVAERVGRPITRAAVLADQGLHAEWIRHKVDVLATCWQSLLAAGQSVNPRLSLGLMIRWGAEERDGLDLDRLLPHFGGSVNLRVGEGHFFAAEYAQPVSQAMEHLVAGYHAGWGPQEVPVQTETTYFPGVTREMILKKVALGLAAGASEVSYCTCVPGALEYQAHIAQDKEFIAQWAAALPDKTALHRPIAIMRTKAAGDGDKNPVQRARDRQPFPLFSLAGLPAVVVRQGAWRDHGKYDVVAITGRSVWDANLERCRDKTLVFDGYALLEKAPAIQALGIRGVVRAAQGLITFTSDFVKTGILWVKDNVVIVPYLWQDVPEPFYTQLLGDIRSILGPCLHTAYVDDAHHVLIVPTPTPRTMPSCWSIPPPCPAWCRLVPPIDRQMLFDNGGQPQEAELLLAPNEIRVLAAK